MIAGSWMFLRQTQLNNCNQIEQIKTVIRHTLINGTNSLGTPHSAGYAYYKEHPKELVAAKVAGYLEIKNFSARRCG